MKAVLKKGTKIVCRITLRTEPIRIWMGGRNNFYRFSHVLPNGDWEFQHVQEAI